MKKKEFKSKNQKLSKEFKRYLHKHPEITEQIPHNSLIVLMPEYDPELSKMNLEIASKSRYKNQLRVYVKVQRHFTQTSPCFTVDKSHLILRKPPRVL